MRGCDPTVRKKRKELDEYTCQLGKLFGIPELTKVPCSEDLEVHHLTYVNFGKENIEDIITVCSRCHYILTNGIRGERPKGKIEVRDSPKPIIPKGDESREKKIEVPDCRNYPITIVKSKTDGPS